MQEMQKMQVQSLGQEGPLEEGKATHSNIVAWIIPWTEEPGALQSMGVTNSQTWLRDCAHTYTCISKGDKRQLLFNSRMLTNKYERNDEWK